MNNINKMLLLGTVLLNSIAIAATKPAKYSGIAKDMRVMARVLESSVAEGKQGSRIRVRAEYLARQGIVLRINLPRGPSGHLPFGAGWRFPETPIAPMPMEPPVAPDTDSDGISAMVDEAMREAELSVANVPGYAPNRVFPNKKGGRLRAYLEQRRKMALERRKLAEQLRKIQQQSRKISTEKRFEYMKKYQSKIDAIRSKMKAKASAMRAQTLKIRQQRRDERNHFSSIMTARILNGFCNYVITPRSLPMGEYVTLEIRHAVTTARGSLNRYFVITPKQLTACRNGKLSGKTLAKLALSYTL